MFFLRSICNQNIEIILVINIKNIVLTKNPYLTMNLKLKITKYYQNGRSLISETPSTSHKSFERIYIYVLNVLVEYHKINLAHFKGFYMQLFEI